MSWYLVMLKGGPIECPPAFQISGEPNRALGFVTTRKASAKSVREAVGLAIEDALAELQESLLAQDAVVPEFSASEVRQLSWVQVAGRRYRGFTFYPWPTRVEASTH